MNCGTVETVTHECSAYCVVHVLRDSEKVKTALLSILTEKNILICSNVNPNAKQIKVMSSIRKLDSFIFK